MKRRELIKVGAVTAGAGLGVPGCAVPRLLSTLGGADGAEAFNTMLDEQLATVARPGMLQRLLGEPATPRTPEVEAMIAEKDALFRRMLGALMVTQGFRELPVETQLEPGVQDRMWTHMDEVGATVFEVGDMLASLDERQRSGVQATLRARPELPMTLGETLDDRAARAGISPARRRQLRSMMAQASFRLRHTDPGSIIDEYVGKVERARAGGGREADALEVADKLGERAFWRYQHLLAAQPGPGTPAAPPAAGAPAPGPTSPAPVPPPPPPPGREPSNPLAAVHTRSARSAAHRGDCATVELLSKKVRDLDPVYHAEVFAKDPALTNCLPRDGRADKPARPPSATDPQPAAAAPVKSQKGRGGLRAGGYMLGIGVVMFGVSAVLVDSAEIFLVGMTVGALLFAIGLLTVLISAIIISANS